MIEKEEKMDIKVNVAEYTVLDSSWNTEKHVPWMRLIRFNRIYLPCKGEGIMEGYGKTYRMKKGKIYFIPAFAQVKLSCEHTFEKYWTHFNIYPDGGKNDIFSLQREPVELPLDKEAFITACSLFQRLCQIYSSKREKSTPLDGEIAHSALLLLVERFLNRIADRTSRQKLPRIFEVICHMQNNLHKPIPLSELGRIAGLHPHYFSRLFREVMGISPEQYIQKLRFHFASLLLHDRSYSIGEIAEMTGFASVSSFSKFFRKCYGTGPREYRQDLQSALPVAENSEKRKKKESDRGQ